MLSVDRVVHAIVGEVKEHLSSGRAYRGWLPLRRRRFRRQRSCLLCGCNGRRVTRRR